VFSIDVPEGAVAATTAVMFAPILGQCNFLASRVDAIAADVFTRLHAQGSFDGRGGR
jgi:hypothetical protein